MVVGVFGCFPSNGFPLIPGGGLRSAGGTTMGLYAGISALGTSSIGTGNLGASGRIREGKAGGSPKSIRA